MVSLEGFLEVFKCDTTFRIQTPDTVDPDETNPTAPWVVTRIDGIGASSLAVARVLIQGHEILKAGIFTKGFDKGVIVNRLHACKEQLVICEQVSQQLSRSINEISTKIATCGIERDNRGRALNPFPKVASLVADTTVFLVHAKRSLAAATAMLASMLDLQLHGSNFHILAERLTAGMAACAPIVDYVKSQAETVKYLVDLRNHQEHPGDIRTIIEDFKVLPDGSIAPPMLYLSGENPMLLCEQLDATASYLVHVTEAIFLHAVMARLSDAFPFFLEEIEPARIKAECPIKYRLSVNLAALNARKDSS